MYQSPKNNGKSSCINYKCYTMIELTFLNELMLIKQTNQKSVIFVTIGIFLDKGYKFQPNICNGCHDVSMMSMDLSGIAVRNIRGADYCCIISRMSKSEAINLR